MKSVNIAFLSLILLLSGVWQEANAQQKKLVQFSGVIRHVNSDAIVPYVTVTNQSYRSQVFAANHQGYFSFVAHEGDTITFTSMGYAPVTFVIPRVGGSKYTNDIRIVTDVVELMVVAPYLLCNIDAL